MIALPDSSTSADPTHDTAPSPHHMSQPPHPASEESIRSPQPDHHRNSTPSISPLSTTSRSHHDYTTNNLPSAQNIDNTHLVTQSNDIDLPAQSPLAQEKSQQPAADIEMADALDLDNDRDDRSSSLSDFEGNFDDQENNFIPTRATPPRVEEADSEAETERLEHTPQKLWPNPSTTKTPSKLNQQSTLQDASSPKSPTRFSPKTLGSPRPDPQSPSPSHRPPIVSPSALAGQKRKRSTPSASDADSPLSDAASDSEEMLPPIIDTNGADTNPVNIPAKSVEDVPVEESTEDTAAPVDVRETPEPDEDEDDDDIDENPYISPMKAARLKGKKQRAKRQKESPPAQKQGYDGEDDDAAEPDDMQEDEDGAAKSEEDIESKKQAQAAYADLAEKFHIFRAKLHGEKLAAAEAELDQLNRPQPTHPDYVAQLQCITSRRDTKIQQEYALLRYKKQALVNQTLAEHAQLHSQFFQESREIRDRRLTQLGTVWYDVQKERRQFQADDADRYTYNFPTKFSDQVRNQANYNREVSIVSGIQRYVGFPAAPEIHGARPSELDDDLKAMKLPRPQTSSIQPPVHQNPINVHGMAARVAQEKWVEQNPWANAQHPAHRQSRSPFNFHNPHAIPSVNLFRQASAQGNRTNSPFTTPLPPQKRADYQSNGIGSAETIGVGSDPPSSAPAHPPTNHTPAGFVGEDGSPINALKMRSAMSNPLANRDDRRNFSNMSSTSTIDVPNDAAAGTDIDRQHNPYAALIHGSMSSSGPAESPASQHPYSTSAMHAQHGRADDRKPPELYESVNFRPAMNAYGTPMQLFTRRSPARKEGQRAT